MQTDNRFLDGVARLFTDAAGAAQAFRTELETMTKARIERLISDLDLVTRDEFETVRAMAAKARAENEKLAARVAELEAVLGIASPKTANARGGTGKTKRRPKQGKGKL